MEEELERALGDFRLWFEEAVEVQGEIPSTPDVPSIDLATVLEHYVGLRQEVNIQTRAVRSQQEQNSTVVERLGQAVDQLTRQQARLDQQSRQSIEDHTRPLLTALIEVHDSLDMAGREIRRTQGHVLPLLRILASDPLEAEPVEPPIRGANRGFWSRWILSPTADAALRAMQDETQKAIEELHQSRMERHDRQQKILESAARIESAITSLLTGYSMGIDRIDRTLRKQGLEPIDAMGRSFDPEEMEALEAVSGTGLPAGQVIEEVRRGYRFKGRVFRCSMVRVARD